MSKKTAKRKPVKKTKVHKSAKFLSEWFASGEGRASVNAKTLGLDEGCELYIRNRLTGAFLAGWNAAEKARKHK